MIGVLSDAHGNFHAFTLALKILLENGAQSIVFLGDAIGYIPNEKVVTHIKSLEDRITCVRGNHEDMLLTETIDSKLDIIYQLKLTKSLLSKDCLHLLSGWRASYRLNLNIGKLLFVHGSPNDPTYGYVNSDTSLSALNPEADFVFMGHSHYPFIKRCGNVVYINVGSCGLPRDNGKYGAVSLFDPKTGLVSILRFDISNSTAQSLEESSEIHPAVTELFNRKRLKMFGEIYE